MSFAYTVKRLLQVRGRYFVSAIGEICHHGDCRIYKAREDSQFCDCGLIHDLEVIDFGLAKVLFKDYAEHMRIQEGLPPVQDEKEYEECKRILEETFGPIYSSSEEVRYCYGEMKRLLSTTFSEEEFPNCYARLEDWLKVHLHSEGQ